MKKILNVMALSIMALNIFIPANISAEQVTLSTYYPAPFGAYDRLKLVPRDTMSLDPYCDDNNDLGTIYYDNGLMERTEGVYLCQKITEDSYQWIMISRPLLSKKQEPVKGKVVCIKESGEFGTCMINPSADGTCGCQ